MNDQIQQALLSLLKTVEYGTKDGISFLSEEIPEVVSQILIWKMTESLIWFLVGIFILAGSIFGFSLVKSKISNARKDFFNNIPWTKYNSSRDSDIPSAEYDFINCGVLYILPTISFMLGLSFLCTNIIWVQILIAPKAYLIEYAASLAK